MDFFEFSQRVSKRVSEMTASVRQLYIVDVSGDELWELYLNSFAPEHNKVFRERREHDCNCCKQFIRAFGGVVAIVNEQVQTIWDIEGVEQYQSVVMALAHRVSTAPIRDYYYSQSVKIGTSLTQGDTTNWYHLSAMIPNRFVYQATVTLASALGELRTAREVFKRGLEELAPEALQTVLELIAQGSLYKGEEWRDTITQFARLQNAYLQKGPVARDLYTWSADVNPIVSRLRNHSIGTLLVNLSAGEDLDTAVRKYESIVAPTNYKRPKAIFTQKMLADAQATVVALGLEKSLEHRFATVDDISAANVLFADRSAKTRLKGNAFDDLAKQAAVSPKSFNRFEEVPLERFLSEVLPGATNVEVLFENRHAGNLASLIAPTHPDSKSLFQWANGFSWAYTGNIADSMKERVKAEGGNVDGVLRFSIRWNEDGKSIVDLDAHAECGNNGISFYEKRPSWANGGFLDVDMINPKDTGIENISWPSDRQMKPGTYKFYVHNYSGHLRHDGFDAEIEFGGVIHSFSHRLAFTNVVKVADVTVHPDGSMTLKNHLEGSERAGKSRQVWGISTGQFHRVQLITNSPNHWGTKCGNKHLFFMLADCVSNETPNGFYNEFLHADLNKHRKVFEALGAKMCIAPSQEQLSGLGFSSTKRDNLICRVIGQSSRIIRIAL